MDGVMSIKVAMSQSMNTDYMTKKWLPTELKDSLPTE